MSPWGVSVSPGGWFRCQGQRVCGLLFPAVPPLSGPASISPWTSCLTPGPPATFRPRSACGGNPPFMNPRWSWLSLSPSDDALTCRSVLSPPEQVTHPSSRDYRTSPLSCPLAAWVPAPQALSHRVFARESPGHPPPVLRGKGPHTLLSLSLCFCDCPVNAWPWVWGAEPRSAVPCGITTLQLAGQSGDVWRKDRGREAVPSPGV